MVSVGQHTQQEQNAMHTITKTVYNYDELKGNAKEKARGWLSEVSTMGDWWDSTYEDAISIGALMGLDVNPRYRGQNNRPDMWFNLSYSQGDGACWGGSIDANKFKGAYRRVKGYAPVDKTLHGIAKACEKLYKDMQAVCKTAKLEWDDCYSYSVTSNDRYNSSKVEGNVSDFEDAVQEIADDFAKWLYRQLRDECDDLTSENGLRELAEANEYTFDEYGNWEG